MVSVLLCVLGGPGNVTSKRPISNRTVWSGFLLLVVLASLGWLIWRDTERERWLAPQPILSLVGFFLGFLLLSWQLDRQHRNTRKANRRQAQDRLRLDLYDKIAERIEATSAPLVEVCGLPTAFMGELTIRLNIFSANNQIILSSKRFPELQTQRAALSRSIIALMSALETYAIVMPEFSEFRKRLGDALRETEVAVGDFNQAALPFAGSENAGPMDWPPTSQHQQVMSSLAGSVMRAATEAMAVVSDLRVEAQNCLLGGLFRRRVPRRTALTATRIARSPDGE